MSGLFANSFYAKRFDSAPTALSTHSAGAHVEPPSKKCCPLSSLGRDHLVLSLQRSLQLPPAAFWAAP
eukprot:3210578-Rhodomonas_salina.2